MLFSKRYSDLLSQKDADKQEDFFGTITFTTKKDIIAELTKLKQILLPNKD